MSKRKDRERAEQTGRLFRGGSLVTPKEARSISDAERNRMRNVGVAALKSSSTSYQIQVLSEALRTGKLSPTKLRKTLEDNAHNEMKKGADKLIKKGQTLTVDVLLEEYRKDKSFQNLASKVGLNQKWFIDLAEAEIARRQ